MFDFACEQGHCFEALARYGEEVPCRRCGAETHRIWGAAPTMISDSIRGGVLIENALCNPDGTPKRYYSHSDIRFAAKERGYENVVRHVTLPGTDKSPHTSRWF